MTVNGLRASLGQKADLGRDRVAVDGVDIAPPEAYTYLMLHKPTGYACTLSDPHAGHLVTELVADCGVRVYPVGRLDVASEGLLLMTNDGDFANAVLHPSHQVDKTYPRHGIRLSKGMRAASGRRPRFGRRAHSSSQGQAAGAGREHSGAGGRDPRGEKAADPADVPGR